MPCHSMDIVDVVNPGQIPVLTCDTLAKQSQWSWPTGYGEDRFFLMLGGLYIEMASLKALGGLLEGSSWTGALTQTGLTTSGTADLFLKASHVTCTRRAHQVTASRCIYFSSLPAGSTIRLWKMQVKWCHLKSGVIQGLMHVLNSKSGTSSCSRNWLLWST